ncbi:MAG: M28 family peptidase [bacterium]
MNFTKKIALFLFVWSVLLSQEKSNYTLKFETASIERVKTHLEYLGSDLFKGRGTGTIGGNLAAKYLAGEFSKYNLTPMGNNGTFYQYVPIHGSTPLKNTKLILENDAATDTLELSKDYLIIKSGQDLITNTPLEMVFVGYGIIANEYDYNDYQSVNVEGKIAVMFEGEPISNDINYFNAQNETIYSNLEAKQRIALSRGAKGCIFIVNPKDQTENYWKELQKTYSFENLSLAYSVSGSLCVLINANKAPLLFNNVKNDYQEVLKKHNERKTIGFPLNTKFYFKGEFKRRDFLAPNIIGMIKGNDPDFNDKYIIISAHYDHLGIGYPVKGDSIYNGVFDNASGTAALLEIAKTFSETVNNFRYSIIFLLVTGEEAGLLGSSYYTNHAIVPLYKTIANINIDGIASFDRFKSISGIGSELSSLNNTLLQTADSCNLKIDEIPDIFMQTDAFRNSDQISFALAGVPSILIMEGLNYENLSYNEGLTKFINYSTNIYHTPFDDLTQPINYNAFIQHVSVIAKFITILNNLPNEPEWNTGIPFNIERLRTKAEKR